MPKKPEVALLDAQCIWDPDMDKIAMDALARLPREQRERGMAIYKRQGPDGLTRYCNSIAIAGDGDGFSFATDPSAGKLAALAHSHPDNKDHPHGHLFSQNDVAVAKQLNLPSYIADVASGDVRRFDPATSKTDRTGGLRGGATSPGTVVGNTKTRRDVLAAAYDLHTPEQKK